MLDLNALLAPSSAAGPSGPRIEYGGPEYMALEVAAQAIPEQRDAAGTQVRQGKAPDWREVDRLSLDLSAKSKDLRVAIYLARAKLALEGFPGFANALELLRGYIRDYWASVHPQLEADEDNDPRIRVSALKSLCGLDTVLREVRMAPLTESRQFGRRSWRDYAIASGQIPAPPAVDGVELPDLSRVQAAFADTPLNVILETQKGLANALRQLDEITELTKALVPAGALDLKPLQSQLQEAKSLLDAEVAKRPESNPGGQAASGTAPEGAVAAGGHIRNRSDVVAALDRICRYYRENEPSSPIPDILERTKRLVPMAFLDILKELTPEGVEKFGLIAGIKEE